MTLHLEEIVEEKGVKGSLEHPWPTQPHGRGRFSSPTPHGSDTITVMFALFLSPQVELMWWHLQLN